MLFHYSYAGTICPVAYIAKCSFTNFFYSMFIFKIDSLTQIIYKLVKVFALLLIKEIPSRKKNIWLKKKDTNFTGGLHNSFLGRYLILNTDTGHESTMQGHGAIQNERVMHCIINSLNLKYCRTDAFSLN